MVLVVTFLFITTSIINNMLAVSNAVRSVRRSQKMTNTRRNGKRTRVSYKNNIPNRFDAKKFPIIINENANGCHGIRQIATEPPPPEAFPTIDQKPAVRKNGWFVTATSTCSSSYSDIFFLVVGVRVRETTHGGAASIDIISGFDKYC